MLLIAQVLAGEALISPGGAVDTATACGDDETAALWAEPPVAEADGDRADVAAPEVPVPA